MPLKTFDEKWLPSSVAKEMRNRAFTGFFRGSLKESKSYLNRCSAVHQPTGTSIGFTRDLGHHSSGWFRNPDYERCFHLSLSFRDPHTGEFTSKNQKLTDEWLSLFYGDNKRLLWIEPPCYEIGKKLDVWHYRLFVHIDWETPLLPRKEVYTKTFTPPGWKSWSEVQAMEMKE